MSGFLESSFENLCLSRYIVKKATRANAPTKTLVLRPALEEELVCSTGRDGAG